MAAAEGSRLRRERVNAGLKQIEVASAAGLTRFRLLDIERGYREPTAEEAAAIRKAIQDLTQIEARKRALLAGGA